MSQQASSHPKVGVLLVNLGTPNSPDPSDVFNYLNEFLTDGRVLDFSWIKRQLLARGVIVPFRYRQSSRLYKQLWTEDGSPLLAHGRSVTTQLQETLGDSFKVVLAMRYQNPSILEGLRDLQKAFVEEIIVLPLFPQYASSTTGSVHQKVMECVKEWQVIPKMSFVSSYADHPALIDAFYDRIQSYERGNYDHILFSFHGLPDRHLRKADPSQTCLTKNCCATPNKNNRFCYKAQCHSTVRALVSRLSLSEGEYTICFQSRLGNDPWIQPYTSDVLKACAEKGYRNVLVVCPAFVCDCLETTLEITHEYGKEFNEMGGGSLQLVEGLNNHPTWIRGLRRIVLEHAGHPLSTV